MNPQSAHGQPSDRDRRLDDRAWEALGHADTTRPSSGFSQRVAALARETPQERPAAILPFVRRFTPLAAAAVLAVTVVVGVLLSSGDRGDKGEDAVATLDDLARMQVALSALPDDPNADPAAILSVVDVEDPADLSDEQLLALLY